MVHILRLPTRVGVIAALFACLNQVEVINLGRQLHP